MRYTLGDIVVSDEITVINTNLCGGDAEIVAAARASVAGVVDLNQIRADLINDPEKQTEYAGLIRYLMANRHGSPFENGGWMQFAVTAPLMVWREHHRHRVGWSFNEQSGRYKTFDPIFWIPNENRPIVPVPDPGDTCSAMIPDGSGNTVICSGSLNKVNAGTKQCMICKAIYEYNTSARPLLMASPDKIPGIRDRLGLGYQNTWQQYLEMIQLGASREVCRAVLGVGIYSTCWTAANPRSMMNFLSLRVYSKDSKVVSRPQWEIQQVAIQYEKVFAAQWPLTYAAFVDSGRVAP